MRTKNLGHGSKLLVQRLAIRMGGRIEVGAMLGGIDARKERGVTRQAHIGRRSGIGEGSGFGGELLEVRGRIALISVYGKVIGAYRI